MTGRHASTPNPVLAVSTSSSSAEVERHFGSLGLDSSTVRTRLGGVPPPPARRPTVRTQCLWASTPRAPPPAGTPTRSSSSLWSSYSSLGIGTYQREDYVFGLTRETSFEITEQAEDCVLGTVNKSS
jgi:hypothetical protein